MLYTPFLEPKLQKRSPIGLKALELAVALKGRLTVASQPRNQHTPFFCQIALHT
jgi:hypothetical protein